MGLRLGRPHIYSNTLQMAVHKLWHVHTGCVLTGRAKLAGANRPSRAEPAGGRLEPMPNSQRPVGSGGGLSSTTALVSSSASIPCALSTIVSAFVSLS